MRGDSEEPAFESRFAAKLRKTFEHADQYILKQIFGVLALRGHAIDVAEERGAPGIDERGEGGLIALPRAFEEC